MKQWRQREPAIPYSKDDSIFEKLAKVNGIKDIKKFLYPSIEDTYDYNLLPNIDDAVNEIHRAIMLNKKISIFADVDMDGVSSTAIAYRYLKNFTNNLEIFHVQRDIGHGIAVAEELIPEGTELLLIVDSSTNDVESCKRISENGISVVILDHHDWEGEDNPHAIIVNPRLPNSKYPNLEVSGALTTWKTMLGLDDLMNTSYSNELMDLAGLSVLADAMSALELENRYYIKHALENIRNLGLRVLMEELKIDFDKFSSTDFLYSVSPCVTAITRMGKIELAIQLMLSDDVGECKSLARELIKANEERKRIQREVVDLVRHQINDNDKIIVIVEPSIGKSFNGVVSQKLAEEYQRPTIVLGHKNEESKQYSGSFRSYGDFPVKEFLSELNHSTYAAGHSCAGGVGVWKNKLNDFKNEINEKLKDHTFDSSITYDLEFDLSDINADLINQINTFYKVSGKGITPSKFLIRDLFPLNKKTLGSGKDTMKTELCATSDTWFMDEDDYESLESKLTALKFKTNESFIEQFPVNQSIDVCGNLNTNIFVKWRPRKEIIKTNQIFITDYRLSE